jgi:predicted nucleic acid-binding protein
MRYVIDTNIWVFYLRKNEQVRQYLRQALTNRDEICIISIVYFELLRGLEKRNDFESLEHIRRLWRTLSYYEATRAVWDTAIKLYVTALRQNHKREDADILIAAFADVLNAVIVTDNVRHFETFGLAIVNWRASNGS